MYINWHAVKRKGSLLGKRRRNGWRRTIEDAVIIVERAYKKSITFMDKVSQALLNSFLT